MKAGVIYHLAKLVIWEPDRFWGKEAPIVVGFAGESSEDIAEYFSSQAPRYKAQNRELVVRRLSIPNEDADPETIKMAAAAFAACHIVYVPEDREERVADLPGYAQMRGVLVVGETRAFTETRGMVGLDVVNKHFVIFANRKNIKHAGIEISAEFLQHAQAVGEDE